MKRKKPASSLTAADVDDDNGWWDAVFGNDSPLGLGAHDGTPTELGRAKWSPIQLMIARYALIQSILRCQICGLEATFVRDRREPWMIIGKVRIQIIHVRRMKKTRRYSLALANDAFGGEKRMADPRTVALVNACHKCAYATRAEWCASPDVFMGKLPCLPRSFARFTVATQTTQEQKRQRFIEGIK